MSASDFKQKADARVLLRKSIILDRLGLELEWKAQIPRLQIVHWLLSVMYRLCNLKELEEWLENSLWSSERRGGRYIGVKTHFQPVQKKTPVLLQQCCAFSSTFSLRYYFLLRLIYYVYAPLLLSGDFSPPKRLRLEYFLVFNAERKFREETVNKQLWFLK